MMTPEKSFDGGDAPVDVEDQSSLLELDSTMENVIDLPPATDINNSVNASMTSDNCEIIDESDRPQNSPCPDPEGSTDPSGSNNNNISNNSDAVPGSPNLTPVKLDSVGHLNEGDTFMSSPTNSSPVSNINAHADQHKLMSSDDECHDECEDGEARPLSRAQQRMRIIKCYALVAIIVLICAVGIPLGAVMLFGSKSEETSFSAASTTTSGTTTTTSTTSENNSPTITTTTAPVVVGDPVVEEDDDGDDDDDSAVETQVPVVVPEPEQEEATTVQDDDFNNEATTSIPEEEVTDAPLIQDGDDGVYNDDLYDDDDTLEGTTNAPALEPWQIVTHPPVIVLFANDTVDTIDDTINDATDETLDETLEEAAVDETPTEDTFGERNVTSDEITHEPMDETTDAPLAEITEAPIEEDAVAEPTSEPTAASDTVTDAPTAGATESPTFAPTVMETLPPVMSPTLAPTIPSTPGPDRSNVYFDLINITSPAVLQDISTAQALSFLWLVEKDQLLPVPTGEKLLQRYVLVIMDHMFHNPLRTAISVPVLDECQWEGVVCDEESGLVTQVNWPHMGLNGQLDVPEMRYMQNFTRLDLSENEMSGTLDNLYEAGIHLKEAHLNYNNFTGYLSEQVGLMNQLEFLNLGHNELEGNIPLSLRSSRGETRPLKWLVLSHNKFSGYLPPDWRMRNLFYLDLGYNYLSGPLPNDWEGNMVKLRHLYLDHNSFTGTLPNYFSRLGNGRIKQLNLNSNYLEGEVPYLWDPKDQLTNMNLQDNNLTVPIDPRVCELSFYALGQMVEMRVDCPICTCDYLCHTCTEVN